MKFRYSRWDGSQKMDDLDAGDVLDALSDDLMNYGDLNAALQRLLRWGTPNIAGLEQLLKQLREARERELGRYNLDSTVEQLRQQVQDVIDTEKSGIERRAIPLRTPLRAGAKSRSLRRHGCLHIRHRGDRCPVQGAAVVQVDQIQMSVLGRFRQHPMTCLAQEQHRRAGYVPIMKIARHELKVPLIGARFCIENHDRTGQ